MHYRSKSKKAGTGSCSPTWSYEPATSLKTALSVTQMSTGQNSIRL